MSKIIKCMFFVLLAAVLPLSVHAQQVTLHLQDVTVRKAFRELEVKGNVSLVYEKNDVDLTRKVTVKVDNQPISKALDQILKGQELIYKINTWREDKFERSVANGTETVFVTLRFCVVRKQLKATLKPNAAGVQLPPHYYRNG